MLQLIAAVAFCISVTGHAGTQTFMPENDLHKFDNLKKYNGEMTEETFNEIIDHVASFYRPVIESHGGTLEMIKNWTDTTVNAYAEQTGDVWKVSMFGGLARREEVTADGFAMVVCHELGHHLGGYPFYGNDDWAASEGQSDYFATQACAKTIWSAQTTENEAHRSSVSAFVKERCDQAYTVPAQQNLCYRAAAAGKSLADLLNALGSNTNPVAFDTPDPKLVEQTQTSHPAAQCRLDTYFNGALCSKSFDIGTIPARSHPSGQDSAEAEFVASKFSCTRFENGGLGARPRCWFGPLAGVSLVASSLEVGETSGNANGHMEPGETFDASISVLNTTTMDMTNVTVTLGSEADFVSIIAPTASYPTIASGSSEAALAPMSFRLNDDATCGAPFTLEYELKAGLLSERMTSTYMVGRLENGSEAGQVVGLEIPDNLEEGITREMEFAASDATSKSQVRLHLDITHNYKGDLKVLLTSPSGNTYLVHDRAGGAGDDILGEFPIDLVAGDQISGTWSIKVSDHASQDVGTFNNWKLMVKNPRCDR